MKYIQLLDENANVEVEAYPFDKVAFPEVVTWKGWIYLLHDKDVEHLKDTVRYFKYEPYLLPRDI